MEIILSIIILIVFLLGMFAFGGQLLSVINWELAVKLVIQEKEFECDPFHTPNEKGIAVIDALLSWATPLACILYFINNSNWVYFGFIGGSIAIYQFGIMVFPRIFLQNNKMRIGGDKSVRFVYIFAPLWGLSGLFMVIFSIIIIKSGVF